MEADFFVNKDKFVKMLEFVAQMRQAQRSYFQGQSSEALIKSKQLEAKLDKAVKFYLDNREKLSDIPF
ncbi:MAG: hypothetical protein ACRC78_12105 [Planktothrix sp.]